MGDLFNLTAPLKIKFEALKHIAHVFAVSAFLASKPSYAGDINTDENVVIFPTAAYERGSVLHVPVHAWIFEDESDSIIYEPALSAFTKLLKLPEESTANPIYRERIGSFLVDNERNKYLDVTIAGEQFRIGPTTANGHIKAEVTLEGSISGPIKIDIVLPEGDERQFFQTITRPSQTGISVISDIDDTIKISQVTDREALIEKTFLKPFQAVSQMPEAYSLWRDQGIEFHWVSSSPWQLYPALEDFMKDVGFPSGSFHLKSVRMKDKTAFNLLASSEKTKPPQILSLLRAYPEREFVLIGDSGEHDPEIYGEIARTHSEHIKHIYIRLVSIEKRNSDRFLEAFRGVPQNKWSLISDGQDLPSSP